MSRVFALYADAMQSGKSTVAATLVAHHNFQQVTIASPLKAMLTVLLESAGYKKAFVQSAIHGEYKTTPLTMFGGRSARNLMQTLGTEWGRNHVGQDVWMPAMDRAIAAAHREGFDVVIDDLRYANEAAHLVNHHKAKLIRVVRPGVEDTTGHSSEGGLKGTTPHHVIVNDAGKEDFLRDLRAKVVDLVVRF